MHRNASPSPPTALPVLSVIIPTLDEAGHLPALLSDLRAQAGIALEAIVSDGGSGDATSRIALEHGARLVAAPRGRARQMNTAAAEARGDYLLFLHADSRLPDPHLLRRALAAMQAACAADGSQALAGHFPLRFLRTQPGQALFYRYLEEKTAFNRPHTFNGDQGLLLHRDFFRQLGEFDARLPFLEDQRLAETIRAQGRWLTLPGELHTSARRFEEEGFGRRYLLMSIMMGLHVAGREEFFCAAPGVYRVQAETGRLLLTPFFRIVRHLMRHAWGLAGTLRTFMRIGDLLRENAWQVFYFFDIVARPLLGPGRYPCLVVHDRLVAPLLRLPGLAAVAGLGCFLWYLGILAPLFRVLEHRHLTVSPAPAPAAVLSSPSKRGRLP